MIYFKIGELKSAFSRVIWFIIFMKNIFWENRKIIYLDILLLLWLKYMVIIF